MHEDCPNWDSGAMLYCVVLAHIWLGLVCAMVRKTWCPAVCWIERLLPLSSEMCADNRHKEEHGPILHGKHGMQILQVDF